MAKNVGSGGKFLRKQDSLAETWTLIGESGLVQLLRNFSGPIKGLNTNFRGSSTKNQNLARAFQYFYKFISRIF